MKWRLLPMIMLIMSATASYAETGFDQRYEQGYNIFNPVNKYQPDNPLNPVNQYNPNNPFNQVNRYHPDNPLNPVNKFNLGVPFAPLDGRSGRRTGAW